MDCGSFGSEGQSILVTENKAKNKFVLKFKASKPKELDTMDVKEHQFSSKTSIHICKVCNDQFQSIKSLSGHMRCHPERKWRGLNPPEEKKFKISSTLPLRKSNIGVADSPPGRVLLQSNSSVADSSPDRVLLQSNSSVLPELLKWSVTARRGRKGTKPSPPNHEDVASAVINLCLLAEEAVRVQEHDETQDMSFISNTSRIEEDRDDLGGGLLPISVNANVEVLVKDCDVETVKKIKVQENVDDSGLATPSRRYECSSCNRSFTSHQALGGHKASHNKGKNNLEGVVAIRENAEGEITNAEEAIDSDIAPSKIEATKHPCNMCSAVFPTGQALGGHKRKHWTGPENPAMNSSESDTKSKSHSPIDFDLNEVPMNTEEDL